MFKAFITLALICSLLLSSSYEVQAQAGNIGAGVGAAANNIGDDSGIKNFVEVDDTVLDNLNPLRVAENTSQDGPIADQLSTPGGFMTRILEFIFPLSLIILFIMTLWGGFEMVSEAASKKNIDAGKQRIKAALIGFIIIFSSYWLIQVIELMLGVKIITP